MSATTGNIDTTPLPVSGHQPWWRRRELRLSLALVSGVLLLVYGMHWWRVDRFMQDTDDAYVRADVVTISPRIAGYVASTGVDDNQPVKAGDVLVTIDDRDYRARVQQAEAAVAAASAAVTAQEAALANMDAQLAQQHSRIAKAEADSVAAAAEAARADADQQRFDTLAGRRAASLQQAQNAETASRKAAAALNGSKADVTSEQQHVTVLRTVREQAVATLAQARAAVLQAQASLRLATIDLDSTVIRAPADGVTGQRSVRTGQYVEPGLPLLAVVPMQSAYVIANYKETQLRRMHAGQPVTLAVDSFDGAPLHGRVESLSPASGAMFALLPPDNATGNFTKIVQRIPVKIMLDEPSRMALRPGMSVIATVDTRSGDGKHER